MPPPKLEAKIFPPDHRAACGEGSHESDDEPAHEPRMADEARALAQQGQQAWLVIGGAAEYGDH